MRDRRLPVGGSQAPVAGGATPQVRLARAGLLRVTEAPTAAVSALVDRIGAESAWAAVSAGEVTGRVRAETEARCQQLGPAALAELAESDLATAAAMGARLVVPEDQEWPAAAVAAFGPAAVRGVTGATAPLGLYVRGGALSRLPETGLSIVGSRACTPYGQRIAAEIALSAVEGGLTVVSGAAFGVDAAAHRAALAAEHELPTVAVLACGIDRAYPAANRPLIDKIAEIGAVVSEYAPGTTPARHRFLVRNRLIAALGAGTVVVEAGRRSGTLSTAAAARHLGRVLMAVPGPVTSALSVGCHLLIRDDHAVLVSDYQDVRELLQPQLFTSADHEQERPLDTLGPICRRVQDALSYRTSRAVAEVAASAGVRAAEVMAALTELDLAGLARRGTDGWRAVRSAAG